MITKLKNASLKTLQCSFYTSTGNPGSVTFKVMSNMMCNVPHTSDIYLYIYIAVKKTILLDELQCAFTSYAHLRHELKHS